MRLSALLVLSVTVFSTVLADSLGGGDRDTCGYVHDELKVPEKYGSKHLTSVGKIEACLCVSDVAQFVTRNPVAKKGASIAGTDYVIKAITAMVNNVGRKCNYPDHASPVCKKDEPCGFDCKDGYKPFPAHNPTKCVCDHPWKECNGKCEKSDYKCPNDHYKRDDDVQGPYCPKGQTACGVRGIGAKKWQCVDTKDDVKNCGGCTIPFNYSSGPKGQDCTTIKGASRVDCVYGRCVIHQCEKGFRLDAHKNTCVRY